jgi:hypothetical protein
MRAVVEHTCIHAATHPKNEAGHRFSSGLETAGAEEVQATACRVKFDALAKKER